MTISLVAAVDGLSGTIQIGGVDKVIIGPDGITPASLAQKLTLMTAQATTSGTSKDFTGIPSWAKRITVMLNTVSTNGVNTLHVQIGNGSVETTGYTASSNVSWSSTSVVSDTTGFPIFINSDTYTLSGALVLTLMGSNTWTAHGAFALTGLPGTVFSGGVKVLSGVLDTLRISAIGGTDVFDNGSVNVLYEG